MTPERNATLVDLVHRRKLAAHMRAIGIDAYEHETFDELLVRLHRAWLDQEAAIKRVSRLSFPFKGHRTMAEVLKDQEKF